MDLCLSELWKQADDYYDATLVVPQEGEYQGKVILSYEDEMGNTYQLENLLP